MSVNCGIAIRKSISLGQSVTCGMKFEDYHIAEEIKRSLKELGWRRPTDIQYKAIPSILKREDVMAVAQTGTGKTAAFAIPILHLLHRRRQGHRPEGIKCVVLAPTHELALQITEVFEQIAKYTKVKTLCLIGGGGSGSSDQGAQPGRGYFGRYPGKAV